MSRLALVLFLLCALLTPPLQAHRGEAPDFPAEVPPWLWERGGPFTLIDQTGRKVTERSFGNDYLLIYFGYTHCTDVCPVGLRTISRALEGLGPQAERVQPIFITTDPKRDTPDRLREFLPLFDSRFIGLTGSKKAVFSATKTYGVRYFSGTIDGNYEVGHTDTFFLMGPDNRLKAYFRGGVSAEAMRAEIAAQMASDSPHP